MKINHDLQAILRAYPREDVRQRLLYQHNRRTLIIMVAYTILSALLIILMCVDIGRADVIDLDRIAQIESSGNPLAISTDGGYGLYQITAVALADYNHYHRTTATLEAMLRPAEARKVAYWMFEERIPQLLRHYGIQDTIANRLRVYNSGIGTVVKGRTPAITKRYIEKYNSF